MIRKTGIGLLIAAALTLTACGGAQTTATQQNAAAGGSGKEAVTEEEPSFAGQNKAELPEEIQEEIPEDIPEEIPGSEDSPDPRFFADGTAEGTPSDDEGFYGIWTDADTNYDMAVSHAKKLYEMGYESYVCYGPEWENITAEPYFCVTAGRYLSEEEAEEALPEVQNAGYPDAYIKPSGMRMYSTVAYYNYGDADTEVSENSVTLSNVPVEIHNVWYPGFDEVENQYAMVLVIDANTVFDASCETEFFGNYKEGDTPLEWFQRNWELKDTDPDAYMAEGPALSGVFEVGINGSHIDRFFGSYWWD